MMVSNTTRVQQLNNNTNNSNDNNNSISTSNDTIFMEDSDSVSTNSELGTRRRRRRRRRRDLDINNDVTVSTTSSVPGTMDNNNFITHLLNKQSTLLSTNFSLDDTHNSGIEIDNKNDNNDCIESDDDIIFIKEEKVKNQQDSVVSLKKEHSIDALTTTKDTQHNHQNYLLVHEDDTSDIMGVTGATDKKQRTVSIPQLPHAKLQYQPPASLLLSNNSNAGNCATSTFHKRYLNSQHSNDFLGDGTNFNGSAIIDYDEDGNELFNTETRGNGGVEEEENDVDNISPNDETKNYGDNNIVDANNLMMNMLNSSTTVTNNNKYNYYDYYNYSNRINNNNIPGDDHINYGFDDEDIDDGSHSTTLKRNRRVSIRVIEDNTSYSPPGGNFLFDQRKKLKVFNHNNAKMSHTLFRTNNNAKIRFDTDEKDGHYIFYPNSIICGGRYLTKDILGKGTFGKVIKCVDLQHQQQQQMEANNNGSNNNSTTKYCALKIIKAIDRYREAAKTELRILITIYKNDRFGEYQCLLLRDFFDYKNHIIIVSDLAGKSVYDFMSSNGVGRFCGSHVQAMARQIIRSTCFLHDLNIVHTDIKPENTLLVDDKHYWEVQLPNPVVKKLSKRRFEASLGKRKILYNPEIKIIDFGSAVFNNEFHPDVVSTRHYRAPEIILGLGWSFPCDIWSIACVLVELVTGESLYPIHENVEHLAMMQRIHGTKIPSKLISKMIFNLEHENELRYAIPSRIIKKELLPYFFKLNNFNRKVGTDEHEAEYCFQWPKRNSRKVLLTPRDSIKRVMDNCDRLDIWLSKKIGRDYPWIILCNMEMDIETNWKLILKNMDTDNASCSELNYGAIPSNTAFNNNQNAYYYDNNKPDRDVFEFWYYFVDLLINMFEFDPEKRLTAKQALEHKWFDMGIIDEGILNYQSAGVVSSHTL
ncbi:uncharacterized protein SCODWIG_01410 [Saccharomycodes ludwigii]|uniref:Protein kinase domain-containing protein n=1 Tax=Saccharomycodes ludwigii TaxID=36035 RepID=A0A376B4Y9_9ASCO|nr:hypothetical protein SCDLUD_001425 [Saccharomycodes ludwigii]KAH3901656.1 hypothetical protein SCDLUD_001425 [Saccharomycodes ludwigii]SSD59649.1 uncharacterized protein SCODWIG_01410 [Saccharomycodes ludwigii]